MYFHLEIPWKNNNSNPQINNNFKGNVSFEGSLIAFSEMFRLDVKYENLKNS